MKVCVISPLGYTGIAYYDHSLCQSLAENGVDVTLLTSQLRIISPHPISYSVKSCFINTYGNLGQLQKGVNYIKSIFRCYWHILRNKYSFVHFQILELPPVDLIFFSLIKFLGIKIIYTPHDIKSFKGGNYKAFQSMYNICDRIIVHNNANKVLLSKDFGIDETKIHVIPHGNYGYFLRKNMTKKDAKNKIHVPEDKKLILIFGNIREGKGIHTALDAVARLDKKDDFVLLIGGRPSKTFDMAIIKQYLELANIILRDTFIADELVEYYYRAADVVLVPYEYAYESGVLRYAFSCGCSTIVSNLDEFGEFVFDGENCLVFPAGNALSLKDKIQQLLSSTALADKIGRNAKQFSDSKWNWKQIAYKTMDVYKELCETAK